MRCILCFCITHISFFMQTNKRKILPAQEAVILTSYVVLSQVRKIFAKPHQPCSWSKRHTDAFANLVFRQTTNLAGCVRFLYCVTTILSRHFCKWPSSSLIFTADSTAGGGTLSCESGCTSQWAAS